MTDDDIQQLAIYIQGRPWPHGDQIFHDAAAGDYEQLALLAGLLSDDLETIRRGLQTLYEIEAMWRKERGED